MCCFDVTLRRDPPPERQLNFQLYDLIGPQWSASAHSCFGTDSRIDVKLLVRWCWSQMDPLRPFLLAKETVVHYIKWAIWHAETHGCRVSSAGWLQHLVSVCPIAPLIVQSQFLFFLVLTRSFFVAIFFLILYTPYVLLIFFYFSAIQSPLSTPSHFNLRRSPSFFFFRLWFRWHLPRVAVIAKCRLGRWDIGQPLPSLLHSSLCHVCHSLCLCFLHAGYSKAFTNEKTHS